jgi:glucan biosynthesis protein C
MPSPAPARPSSERIHALDTLRAVMLFCVVLFHCVLSFTVRPLNLWVYKDNVHTYLADVIVAFVHVFTLPTFFILAGFFSAMLYVQRGALEFTRNRAMRIALPFLVGWVLLSPVITAGFIFAILSERLSSVARGFDAVGIAIFRGNIFFDDLTHHLWFMYYLLYFYAALLAVGGIAARLPESWRQGAVTLFSAMIARPWLRLPLLTLLSFGILWIAGGALYASLSFVPKPHVVLGYGFYFGFGCLLYLVRQHIAKFERLAWTHVLAGLIVFFIITPLAGMWLRRTGAPFALPDLLMTVNAVVFWLLFFGVTGLFLRHFNRPSPAVRYVVEASFWIYLIHLPVVIWLSGLLTVSPAPALLKILMLLSATYLTGFITYDLFVRSTFIGYGLNGRRYGRLLFRRSAVEPAPA